MRRLLGSVVVALALSTTGCASLPPQEGRIVTATLVDTDDTQLGRAVVPSLAARPGKTGIHPLAEPYDAIAARILLAAAAERSLDVQYYIWRADPVGYLLFEALWRAAERGVRVRLLLDDLNTGGLDPTIAALDSHPNIEVRLYNPVVHRGLRALNFLTDFARVNRRMHNKSFTIDNQASVVGGRNIGNEYFGAGDRIGFADLDVIAVGPAVHEVSRQFDLYWNSPSAYPAARLAGVAGPTEREALEARFAETRSDPRSLAYLEAVRAIPLVRELIDNRLAMEWTTAQLVYDDPAKTLDIAGRTDLLLFPELVRRIGQPDTSLDLVSPYFVPGTTGTAALAALARRGVKVRILTNSLSASDVKAVHSGYARRRHELVEAGVQLYELKSSHADASPRHPGAFGSSSPASLHAKTFAVDRSRIFVGSFNFDPRSALLNTELGLVIQSPLLSQRLARLFDDEMSMAAYEVRLAPDGRGLEWIDRTASGVTHHRAEPGTTWWMRRQVDLLSILPIEWLL
jgi:putative cardiolipin synthase